MLRTGIFIKTGLENLISKLSDWMTAYGPPRLTVETESEGGPLEGRSVLELSQWSSDWCFIEVEGPEELLTMVVQSMVRGDPGLEILTCHYDPTAGDYGYAYYKDGDALETFESMGSAIESVNFTSEIRRVPLQNLLRASDFMEESIAWLGMRDLSSPTVDSRKIQLYVKLPGKKTFWQSLLGTAWPR